MSWNLFTKTVTELSPSLLWTTLYFQGEPFLHPRFLDMVEYCHRKGIYTYTSTNAQLISDAMAKEIVKSGLDRLVVSADGLTQEVYEQYRRGGDLDKVRCCISSLVHWKKELNSRTPLIEFQFIVMKHNEFQLDNVKKTARMWGADKVSIKSAQIDLERVDQLIPANTKFARYKKGKTGVWQLKKKSHNRCWRQWSNAVIAANGDVLPCCFDKNGQYSFGNIQNDSFSNIWNGEIARKFRRSIRENRKEISICNNCTE